MVDPRVPAASRLREASPPGLPLVAPSVFRAREADPEVDSSLGWLPLLPDNLEFVAVLGKVPMEKHHFGCS